MNRLATLTLIGAVFLSACRRAGDLPPEEVLRRATQVSGQLQSARVDADLDAVVSMSGSTLSGTATAQGVLTNAGDQAEFLVHAQGILDGSTPLTTDPLTTGARHLTFRFSADVVRDAEESYLRLREASVDPPAALPQGWDALTGIWWTLPRSDDGHPSVRSLTPDPRFLRAQSAVVTVVDDLGLEDIGGRDAYHYRVSIDPDRLIGLMQGVAEERGQPFSVEETRRTLERYDARGELWIDADTFVVDRIAWIVSSRESPPATRIAFRVGLTEHDSALTVTVPTEATPLDSAFIPTMMNATLITAPGALLQ